MNEKMNRMREKTISDTPIYKGRILDIHNYEVELPDGHHSHREVVRKSKAACVLAITDDNQVILEEQYRYPFDEIMIEVPAGKSEPDEDPQLTATRELEEETGYTASHIELLGEFDPTIAFTDERIYMYLATGLTHKQQHLDQGETLDYYTVPLEEAVRLVKENKIRDGKTIAIISLYLMKYKGLN